MKMLTSNICFVMAFALVISSMTVTEASAGNDNSVISIVYQYADGSYVSPAPGPAIYTVQKGSNSFELNGVDKLPSPISFRFDVDEEFRKSP